MSGLLLDYKLTGHGCPIKGKIMKHLNNELKNKLGKIVISDVAYEEFSDELRKILSDLLIMKVEHQPYNCNYELIAFCPHFRVLEEGAVIPNYMAICNESGHSFIELPKK